MIKIIKDGNPEKDMPSILYKYRNWKDDYHKGLLTHNEIYFASPKDFNDPYDCRITERFVNRTPEEIENYKTKLADSHKKDLAPGLTFGQMKKNLMKE